MFYHSIRIRLRSDEKEDKKAVEAATGASTPSATDAESAGASESESVAGGAAGRDETTPEGGHLKEKTGALVGKINNLVTTDATTLQDSWLLIETRESRIYPDFFVTDFGIVLSVTTFLQAFISIFVLYRLLSWR